MSPRRCLPLLLILLLWGCDSGEPTTGPSPSSSAAPMGEPDPALAQATLEAWQQGQQWLSETQSRCTALHEQIQTLLATPDATQLQGAREQWHQCHNHWHRMDVLLALGESNPGLFGDLNNVRFSIDAHPLQPGYLDAIEGYPYSGIVNDITLDINAQTLRTQHGLTDDSDVALGLHALEFLLWGENGERPVVDFEHQSEPRDDQLSDELTEGQLPNNRRRELMRLVSQLLQDDLNAFHNRWRSSEDRWARTYQKLHPASRLTLLRDALRVTLQDQLPTAIAQHQDPELGHSRFAGNSLTPVASALEGISELADSGDLKASLVPGGDRQSWEEAWSPIEQWLAESDSLETDRLTEALQALGETLNPELPPIDASQDAPSSPDTGA